MDGDTPDPARVRLLERWLDQGLELGNHGYDHLSLNRIDATRWLADVQRGEVVTRPLVEGRGKELRWFRHPFLHTGRSAEIQRSTQEALAEMGYRIAPVTLDNGEWIYGGAYSTAWNRQDEATKTKLGEDYVRYMLEVVDYYQQQSLVIVGEAIPQVLLIHAYALNAEWLGRLLEALEARGAEWVSLEKALEHPAYERDPHGYTGAGGITWLHRWAITAGLPGSTFGGEPEVPAWVETLRQSYREEPPVMDLQPNGPLPLVVDRVELHRVRSAINDVEYELRVSLPVGYEESQQRYPVLYLLDADYSFLLARGIVDHLSQRNDLKRVITVGVAYPDGKDPKRYRKNRTRDYTPTFVTSGGYGPEYQTVSGGGPKFQRILQSELIPFVEGRYRTSPTNRTLVGHSFGGLFATWTMLTEPGLFDNFIIASPSLWYDQGVVLGRETSLASETSSLPANAYFCVGSREVNRQHNMVRDLKTLTEQLKLHAYRDFNYRSEVLNDETHNSVFPRCLSNGLRFVLSPP